MGINTELVKLALWRQKKAFVPAPGGAPPMDPAMMGGGMPPMDPAAAGGAMLPPPPGAAPPMDPAMMGGGMPPMPPMDPAMMGGGMGMGGMGGGGDIRSIIREELSSAGLIPGGGGGGMAGPGGKPMKAPKADINTIATDLFQLKKMFLHFLRIQGIELPPDILDGPNRDPLTGAPAASPTGGSDVAPGASQQQPPQSAIPPIEPMQGAFPMPGGGGADGGEAGKTAAAEIDEMLETSDGFGSPVATAGSDGRKVMSKAAALSMMFRRKRTSS